MRVYLLIVPIVFASCGAKKIYSYEDHSTPINQEIAEGGLDSIIHPYRASLEEQMNEVIGESEITLNKFTPESPLGNFAAEAVYKRGMDIGRNLEGWRDDVETRAFSLLNYGGLRSSINAGVVTVGDMYELMPFDNTLVLVKISGEKMRECADYLHDMFGQPVFNATFRLTEDERSMTIGGEPYAFDQDVVIFTSNYLADGGDKMSFFKEPIKKYDTGIFIRDVFIDEVRAKGDLPNYKQTGKYHIVKTNG